jgi:hypothetical protein
MDYNLTLFKGSVEEVLLSHNGIPASSNTNNTSIINATNSLKRE